MQTHGGTGGDEEERAPGFLDFVNKTDEIYSLLWNKTTHYIFYLEVFFDEEIFISH